MWLTNSSVGRKVVMSITGLFLVLFVTFHALMNAVAVLSFGAYDKICEFLGANWYAVLGTAVIAGGMVVHIIYAFWLTYQNRKARGGDRYAISKNWKSVSWASQNMLVLGVIVFCFLILHLVQFWAKMQVPELLGEHVMNGKYYLGAVFSQVWVALLQSGSTSLTVSGAHSRPSVWLTTSGFAVGEPLHAFGLP